MTTRVFHRQPKTHLPKAVGGHGAYLWDASGKRYLDASGGAAVSCLGHGHPAIVEAVKQQVDALAFAHTGFFTNDPMEALADLLVADAPEGISHAYFVSGGSEGVEAALKMARQYFLEIGQPQRRHFIARRQSYHGNTLGALSVGGNLWRRAPFDPILLPSAQVPPCYAYRDKSPNETDEQYGERIANELEKEILHLGTDSVIAFIVETVGGATLGAVPPVPGYFRHVREICNRYGVLLILDEVMCGMGRTGTLHAVEQEGISPDLLVIAKGLGAGYQPIGAVLVSGGIYDAIRNGSGFFQHGHTYTGHATACAAALATQRTIKAENLLENVRRCSDALRTTLDERFGNHHHVGDIRGRGLFLALEFVRDRASKEPFDPGLKLHARIKREAMDRGLLCYPMGGLIDGVRGDHALLAPPFTIGTAETDEIVEKLSDSVDAAIAEARKESAA